MQSVETTTSSPNITNAVLAVRADGRVGETKIEHRRFAFTPKTSMFFCYKEQRLKQIKIWLQFYYTQYRFTMTASYGFSWVKEGLITENVFNANKKLEKSMSIVDYKKYRDPFGYV